MIKLYYWLGAAYQAKILLSRRLFKLLSSCLSNVKGNEELTQFVISYLYLPTGYELFCWLTVTFNAGGECLLVGLKTFFLATFIYVYSTYMLVYMRALFSNKWINLMVHLCDCGFICRTLMGIMDDYFDGYYSEDLIECQVAMISYYSISMPYLNKLPLLWFIVDKLYAQYCIFPGGPTCF